MTKIITLLICLTYAFELNAQWNSNTAINKQITSNITTSGWDTEDIKMLSDGNGGSYVLWPEGSFFNDGIRVQHLDANGYELWTAGGVDICPNTGLESLPTMCSDNNGGIIVTWEDSRNSIFRDIYAQRFNSNGVKQWGVNGVAVCIATDDQFAPQVVSLLNGNSMVIWHDSRFAGQHIFAQKLNSNGIAQWTNNGVGTSFESINIRAIGDNYGGAYISFIDYTNVSDSKEMLFNIDGSGFLPWGGNAMQLSETGDAAYYHKLNIDGNHMAIVAWVDEDADDTGYEFLKVQRINYSGTIQWPNPIKIDSNLSNNMIGPPSLDVDVNNDLFLAWHNFYAYPLSNEVKCQKIVAGVPQWSNIVGLPGYFLTQVNLDQMYPVIASDGAGGAIISWQDERQNLETDIYLQHINNAGNNLWQSNGILLCNAGNDQRYPVIVMDNNYGSIISWIDFRNGGLQTSVYAAHYGYSFAAPTKLISFYAQYIDAKSQLSWETSNEDNVLEYQIEFSIDGSNFKNIGREKATNQVNNKYHFDHSNTPVGTNYYRLKIIDYDGKYEYSPIRSIHGSGSDLENATIYPNPFHESLTIELAYAKKSKLELSILNSIGQVVYSNSELIKEGLNTINLSLTALPNGMYYVSMRDGEKKVIKKVIKQ